MTPRGPGLAPGWLLLVVVLAWVAQGGVLARDWLHDDIAVRTASGPAGAGPSLGRALAPDAWADTLEAGAWRPVASVSLALEASIWEGRAGGGDAFGFRVTNLLLHGLCALLLLALLMRWMPERPAIAVGAAAVFAAHPMHAPTIAALAGRADLLALAFSLAAALAWNAARPGRRAWLPVAALAWFFAILSKESAIGLPLVLLLVDAVRAKGAGLLAGEAEPWLLRARLAVVFVLPLVLWFVVQPGPEAAGVDPDLVPLGDRALLGFLAMGRAAARVALPVGLLEDPVLAGGSVTLAGTATWVALATLVLTLLAAVRAAMRKAGPLSLAWLAFALLALPAAFVLPAAALAGPRFPYVPAAPLFLVAGLLVGSLLAAPVARRLGQAGAVAGALALVLLARAEGAPWRGARLFHEAVLAADPANLKTRLALAREAREGAESSMQRATRLPADDRERLALLADAAANLQRAHDHTRAAVASGPGRTDPAAWAEHGAVLLARRELPDAEQALEQALKLDPLLSGAASRPEDVPPRRRDELATIFYRLGVVHEGLGQTDRAAFRFEYAADLSPNDPRAAEKAGAALARIQRFGDAIRWLERAQRNAESEAARTRIARTLAETRRTARATADRAMREAQAAEDVADYATARDLFEAAILADPSRVDPYLGAARLRGSTFGQYAIARSHLDEALRRSASLPTEARESYALRIRNVRALVEAQEKRDLEEERLWEEEERGAGK